MAKVRNPAALASLAVVLGSGFAALNWLRPHEAGESALPLMREFQAEHKAVARAVSETVAPLSPTQEREFGRRIDAGIAPSARAGGGVLQNLGRRLEASPLVRRYKDYTFRLVPGLSNAFAVPGGFVYVMEGLNTRFAGRRDLMAFVLAHEIGHVELGHCADSVRYQALSRNLGVGPAGDVVQLLHSLSQLNYNKVQELEADAFAIRLLKSTDFRASAGAEAIRMMLGTQPPERQQPGEVLSDIFWDYLRTHPADQERVAELERLAR